MCCRTVVSTHTMLPPPAWCRSRSIGIAGGTAVRPKRFKNACMAARKCSWTWIASGKAGVGKRFVVAPVLFLGGRAVIMPRLLLGGAWPRDKSNTIPP
jgi:hypothetical protein